MSFQLRSKACLSEGAFLRSAGSEFQPVSKYAWSLPSTETIRLIRDGEKGGKGVWRWGEKDIIYLSVYTVITRMTSAVRWAAMRATLMFHNCEGQSPKTVSTDLFFFFFFFGPNK